MNPLWKKIIAAIIDRSWNDARYHSQTPRISQPQQALLDSLGSALADLATLAIPSVSPRSSALKREPRRKKSLVCLDLPLQSLLAQVAALGSFSMSVLSSFLPQLFRSMSWFAFLRTAFSDISPGVY